ncbi:zinc ABC transporter ATP-binding protein ZnuC [uncultured Marinobacter sp.]|mgnify:CR=1 FL=1|uniref:zinc ABC transporter ATP-binding protein ZnuC n=1 Tax=uncultured Marinobacter sp. TaxID=187379 RepID=UPI0030D8BF83
MSEPLVVLDQVSVAFNDLPVVDRVSLVVNRGDILTIIGPNGAGKTTLIKAVLGIQAVTSGQVRRARGVAIGYVPQHLQLQNTLPLSVRRFMSLTGVGETACQEALAQTGIAHLYRASVHHLSGGEMQRLLLARALVRKPDLLVLDEPAQGVDINGQAALYDLIRDVRNKLNCGVIMISHDLHLVMAATDRVICLNQHVCCSGFPADISHDPAFIETFGKPVAESLAVYHHHHNHRHDLHGDVVDGQPGADEHDHAHHNHEGNGHHHVHS